MTTKEMSKLAQSIKSFEDIHKVYELFEEDGSLTYEGSKFLHEAEINDFDLYCNIKWNDHTKFHMRSRVGNYWYGGGEEEDNKYYKAWCELHGVL